MFKQKIFGFLSLGFATITLASCAPLDGERKNLSTYENSFRDSIINSCLANPNIKNKKNKSKYCVCYGNAFVDRFEENTLQQITQYSVNAKTKDLPEAVNLMMRPELLVCEEKFGQL